MSQAAFETPVRDSVQKINNEIAVGEDLDFQRRWWRFERVVWTLFVVVILCDIAGVFGRGPLAGAHIKNSVLDVSYDRIQRYSTPSIVKVRLDPAAASDGKYHLSVSESLIDDLGTERVIPEPESTAMGGGGLTYTFAAVPGSPGIAQFALEPTKPGVFHFTLQVPGTPAIHARIFVMP
jgi:hypothetical protein